MLTLLLATILSLPACSGWRCDGTNLVVTPIDRSALTGPVTLEARLTSGGDAVRGAPISFFIRWAESRKGPIGGRVVGGATTDADGIARTSFRGGLAALEPTDVIIGYSAEFRFTGSVPGRENQFCGSQGKFEFA